MNGKTEREYWNDRGKLYPRSFFGSPTTNFYLEDEKRLFRQHFGGMNGRTLLKLDLWNEAQNTEILFWAAQEGARCYAIDIAESTASKAKIRSRDLGVPVGIVVGNVASIPFPDNYFDCIYTMGTIEHILDPEAALSEIARVLKPDGLAIVGVPNKKDPFLFSLASRLMQACGKYPYGRERWYTNTDLCHGLQKQGLRVLNRDGILFLPWFLRFLDLYLWLHYHKACRLTSTLVKPFSRLAATLPNLAQKYGYMTVSIATK